MSVRLLLFTEFVVAQNNSSMKQAEGSDLEKKLKIKKHLHETSLC